MVWKIIWRDSLRYDGSAFYMSSIIPLLCYINIFNFVNSKSIHQLIVRMFFIAVVLLFIFFPIRLAKGLYLCPLTEKDRKKYLMTACYIRFGILMLLYTIVMIFLRIFFEVNIIVLLLQYVFGGIVIFTITLLYLHPGIYSAESAMQTYYSVRKTPIHIKPKLKKLNKKTAKRSITLLIIAMVFGAVGLFLSMSKYELNPFLWFFYIPDLLCLAICLIVYYKKYLNEVIAFYANQEFYHYMKKEAGVFHAD